jgi:hypothetical protein
MLKYQIHKLSKGGKEARAVLLEDILTSDVFGLMAYFPYDLLLKPFLEQVNLRNPQSNFLVPHVEPTAVHFWKSFPWPENLPNLNRESIEPDVVIEWPELLLIVEAKFVSPTDPEELLREYLIGGCEAETGQRFYLLLIDKNLSPPSVSYQQDTSKVEISKYIEGRILDLECAADFPTSEVASTFLWTNWQSFYALVDDLVSTRSRNEETSLNKIHQNILGDVLEVLRRKGLIPFEPLLLGEFNEYEIDLLTLGEIGEIIRRADTDLSELFIDLDAFGKVGLRVSDPLPALAELELHSDDLNTLLSNKKDLRR